MTDVLFCGYFGFGNLGDETLLGALAGETLRREQGLSLAALSGPQPGYWKESVEPIPRTRAAAAVRSARLLCMGPGGIFQDATSTLSCVWYAEKVLRAKRAGVPVVHVGQSIGPLRTRIARGIARWALGCSGGVAVRDDRSLRLAEELAPEVPITRSADAAWLVPSWSVGERAPRLVALAPRPWRRAGTTPEWWGRVARGLAELGCDVLWVGFAPDDLRLAGEAKRLSGVAADAVGPHARPEEAVAALGRCGGLLAMRLHALILGALAGLSLNGVSYDPKIDGLLDRLGQAPLCGAASPYDPTDVAQSVARSLGHVPNAAAVERERELARRNVDVIMEALGEP